MSAAINLSQDNNNDLMENVGHSRLLKFIVNGNKLNKMATPVFKIEFENITPSNIESEVPGKQELREGYDATVEQAMQNSTVALHDKVENPKDYVLSPVITVTKQEAEFTKGDLKLQKVSVTENISEENPKIHSDVIKEHQPVRVMDNDGRIRTRIPKLKQVVEAIRDRRGFSDKNDEVPPTRLMQKRSSIPRLKDSRIPPPLDRRASKSDIKAETPQPEEEFEKIYDEIVVSEPKEIMAEIDNVKVEDPEKIENKFEEIIHDYEDNKVQPITVDVPVERPRYSKIPLSKRKSEQEIKIPKVDEKAIPKKDENKVENIDTKIPIPKDDPHRSIRSKYSFARSNSKPNNENLNKIADNNQDAINTPSEKNYFHNEISYIEPVKMTTQKLVETKIEEVVINKIDTANHKEKDIVKNLDNTELTNPETISEVTQNTQLELGKAIETVTKANGTIEKQNSHTDLNQDEIEIMDVKYTPGKVSRLLQRLRSQEFGINNSESKKDIIIDVPKNKSILSKIAMFERQELKGDVTPKLSIKPKVLKSDLTKEILVDRTPIIVDELLKDEKNTYSPENVNKNNDSLQFDNNVTKDYMVEIVENKVKYQEIQIIDTNKSKDNIRDTKILKPEVNNRIVIDEPILESTPKLDNIQSDDSINDFNKLGSEKWTNRELLEPPPPSIEEKVPRSIVIETLEHKPSEYEIQAPIIIEETTSNNSHDDISDKLKNEPNNNNIKIEIPNKKETQIERDREYKSLEIYNDVHADEVFTNDEVEIIKRVKENGEVKRERPKSLAEMDLGDAVKGKVHQMIIRMNSTEKIETNKKVIDPRERPRKKSVSKIIALFEKSARTEPTSTQRPVTTKITTPPPDANDEELQARITELANAKLVHGRAENMTYMVLGNGVEMPVLALGTALLDKRLANPVVKAAIDMGYRAIDTAYIYGNEKEIGEAIRAKIEDGTVRREDLFITSKLWSTFHRRDLVPEACNASLKAMGLKYFDLYLIHNPMSFKEGSDPVPKIANVVQYSTSDFMDAWYGMETLVTNGSVKSIGVSNFNTNQVQRILDKAKIKPVINQVECHPYLSQDELAKFCSSRDVKLSCFGVLGSKGTPKEYTSGVPAVIDDPMVKVMAAGLKVSPAQLLIRYQIDSGHAVVVKASTASHLWENLQALLVTLTSVEVNGLNALNRNRRIFTFKGMGDTHRNYPFKPTPLLL
ncbi:titin isoform X2 [Amyelois transitella]|uniref:titin isoform X2 n=1 Tax=Amyelois transitella TaxID=680683 RepID=UPI0029902F20|nr:titin isoform X2 [Amyelois transitella]